MRVVQRVNVRVARRVGPSSGENLSILRLPPCVWPCVQGCPGVVAVLRGHGLRLISGRKRNGQESHKDMSSGRAEDAGVFQGGRAALGRSRNRDQRVQEFWAFSTDHRWVGVTRKGNSRSITERRRLPLRPG